MVILGTMAGWLLAPADSHPLSQLWMALDCPPAGTLQMALTQPQPPFVLPKISFSFLISICNICWHFMVSARMHYIIEQLISFKPLFSFLSHYPDQPLWACWPFSHADMSPCRVGLAH